MLRRDPGDEVTATSMRRLSRVAFLFDAGLPAPGRGEAEDLERTRGEAISALMRSDRATDPARRARLLEIARLFVTQGGGDPAKDLPRAKPG